MSKRTLLPALLFTFGLLALPVGAVAGDGEVARALARIRSRPHSPMPAPLTSVATGPAGEGMVVVNGTPHKLHVFFDGPVARRVVVPRNASRGVTLLVGSYEVGVEAPGTRVRPFYGRQHYRANTHYRLRFYLVKRRRP